MTEEREGMRGSELGGRAQVKSWLATAAIVLSVALFSTLPAAGAEIDVDAKLGSFDEYIEKLVKDWNAPGVAVGIVVGDELVFSKGYGYRDYGKKLPVTPKTLFQIASN